MSSRSKNLIEIKKCGSVFTNSGIYLYKLKKNRWMVKTCLVLK